MYKILIVDDEPLSRIGLSTMITSSFPQVELIGSAQDGQDALRLIQQNTPDIIITDIKMPVMDGLELLEYVKKNYPEPHPLFIFLTSFEDFPYVQTALKLQAYDYLIKMEFNKDILTETLTRAFKKISENKKKYFSSGADEESPNSNLFVNRFLYHLLDSGYYSEEQILELADEYRLDLKASFYQTAAFQLHYPSESRFHESKSQYQLYMSILNTVKTVLNRYADSLMVAYNHQIIGALLLIKEKTDIHTVCTQIFEDVSSLCRQYFNLNLYAGIGIITDSVADVSSSFSCARRALEDVSESEKLVFFDTHRHLVRKNESHFTINELNHNLITALEHNDIHLFEQTVDRLNEQLDQSSPESVINMISCLIHWIINCLANGEKLLNEAFAKEPKGYQVLYAYHTREEISGYLSKISNLVHSVMQKQLNDPKYKITMDAKAYIQEHIYNKLSLSEVANAIGISQNYLSSLFKLYNDLGFSDYVASLKIKMAQQLLATEHLKIYQVSEKLGFDNPQYFSKVYKKYTGYSPSEFTAASQEGHYPGRLPENN